MYKLRKKMKEQAKKDIKERAWANHSRECPECNQPLQLKMFIVRAFRDAKEEGRLVAANLYGDAKISIYFVHCPKCSFQKRTFERFSFIEE